MKTKKIVAVLLVVLIALSVFAGCTSSKNNEEDLANRTITVTDMSGDEVTIEGEVKTIVNLWPAGTSSFFVMGAGDLVCGLAMNTPATMNGWTKFFYEGCTEIQGLGGTTPAVEELVKLEPDLVIVHPSSAKDGYAQQVRDAGIPAININFSNYDTMIQAYTMLAEILGGEYKEKLTWWCTEVGTKIENNRNLVANVADEDKPVVMYISGQSDSLTATMGQNTIIQDWVEANGGKYLPAVINLAGNEITVEEIFAANPDVIIVGGVYQHQLLEQIATSDGWKDLKAVQNGRVYNNPYACFNWDRFGLESYLQVDYALLCIQPEIAEANGITKDYMADQIISFYKTMNGTELTKDQANNMLNGLLPDGTQELN